MGKSLPFKKSDKPKFGYVKKINPHNSKKTAQDTIPFIECYDNGLFLTAPDAYTLIFAFENLDYKLFRDEEQREIYNGYMKLLNALPFDISYQEFLMNSKVNTEKLKRTLLPKSDEYGQYLTSEYAKMNLENIQKSETSASEKVLLVALSYKPQGTIDNVNTLFKYYNDIKTAFSLLKSDCRQLMPEEVFAVLFEFYHPFDGVDFLLPKNIYKSGMSIKDYIAPSMFAFKSKEIEIGNAFTRIMFVSKYDRTIDDGFISDLLDNNKRITVSKHIKHIEKSEALKVINNQILNVQNDIQKRMEANKKRGGDFIPFKYLEKKQELEELQTQLSGTNCEFFEIGVFIAISAPTKEELETLTTDIQGKAAKHQVKIDTLMRQQPKALDTLLPMGINYFSVKNGNSVNTSQMTEMVGTLIPFSTRTYFSVNGLPYGLNKATQSLIVLDRAEEMNANGFTLGSSGSGKSMFTKAELIDVLMKFPNDEIIVIDPEREYQNLVDKFGGEMLSISATSPTKMNIFDTDLNYSDEGNSAISMKVDFIMTVVETALGMPLSSVQKSILDRVTKQVYRPFIESGGNKKFLPTLVEFYDTLLTQDEPESHTIATALELYVKGSFQTFSGHTNIDIKKKFLVIDILSMGEQLKTVGIQVILEFLWQRVIENKSKGIRTWVWCDDEYVKQNLQKLT